MKEVIKIITFFLINVSLLAQGFGSSGALDARNISLGGTNATFARGVNAIGVNPANLVVEQDHNIELSTVIPFPSINISLGNDFITLDDYQYFFTGVEGENGEINGRYLDDSEKNKFLNLFDQGSMINTNIGTNLLSFSIYPSKEIGAIGFAIQDWSSAQISLPKQVFELFLFGNDPGKTFDLNELDVRAWYLRNYSLTYSRDLTKFFPDAFNFFSAGLTLKMVQGFFYAGVDKINTTLETQNDYDIRVNGDSRMLVASSPSFGIVYDFEDEDIERKSNVGLFNDPAGSGFGVDFGFYAELNKAWSIAFAVTDLGSITWDQGTIEYTSNGSFLLEDITDETLVDSLTDAITGEGNYTEAFTTKLSTAMKIGVGLKLHKFLKSNFPGKMNIELNYHQGFNNMPANSTIERFSLGAEWIPMGWLKLRTGISVGGYDDFNWGFGLGFDTGLLDFDFATAYTHSIFDGNNAKRLGFAMSTRWTF
jgi:Family of unknown function (DUF5723)